MSKQGDYTEEHIERLLSVIDANKDGKVQQSLLMFQVNHLFVVQIDYLEFSNRFLEPVMAIGFNFVVLLTQLDQLGAAHVFRMFVLALLITGCPATRTIIEPFIASTSGQTLLRFFKEQLGTIEILGKSNRVERVYFKIDTVKKEHWRTRHLQVQIIIVISAFVADCPVEKQGGLPERCGAGKSQGQASAIRRLLRCLSARHIVNSH